MNNLSQRNLGEADTGELIVSVVPNSYSSPNGIASFANIIYDIWNGRYRPLIDPYRKNLAKYGKIESVEKQKYRLPAFKVSGTFSGMNNADLIKHAGIIHLDFDGLSPIQKNTLAQFLLSSVLTPYILAMFQSPSWTETHAGLKIFVLYQGVHDEKTHKRAVDDLIDRFMNLPGRDKAIEPCDGAKALSKLCYMSFDPHLYHNPEAYRESLPMPDPKPIAKTFDHRSRQQRIPNTGNIYGKTQNELFQMFLQQDIAAVNRILNNAVNGERHACRVKAGKLAGGSFAAGFITAYETEMFKAKIYDTAKIRKTEEVKAFSDGFATGQNEPLDDFDTRMAKHITYCETKLGPIKQKPVYQISQPPEPDRFKRDDAEPPEAIEIEQDEYEEPDDTDPLPLEDDEIESAKAVFNRKHAFIVMTGKSRVMNHVTNQVFGTPDVDFSSLPDFRNRYLDQFSFLPPAKEGDKKTKLMHTQAWLSSSDKISYQNGLTFDPTGKGLPGCYNLWNGFAVEPKQGDWSLMENHMFDIICDGNMGHYQWLFAWLCDIFQNPGHNQKKGSSIILRGKQRIGKNAFSDYIDMLWGASGMTVTNPSHITGKFNHHLRNIVFLVANEAFLAHGITAHSALKNIITESHVMCEPKGVDASMMRNHVRVMMLSNHDKVIHADLDESRFLVLDVPEIKKNDREYFGKLHEQMDNGGLEALLYDLLNTEISAEINLREPPKTEGLFDQIADNDNPFLGWWIDRLEDRAGLWNLSTVIKPEALLIEFNRFIENIPNNKNVGLTSRGFGKELKKVIAVKRCRANSKHVKMCEGLESQEWIYVLPDLLNARQQFEHHFGGTINWPGFDDTDD